jgi:hypothetical protein
VTRLTLSVDGFATVRRFTLAGVPADSPTAFLLPYIGDYMQLVAVGTTFYGVFSTANTPDRTHFPNGIVFHRNASFERRQLLDTDGKRLRDRSIDPFFYRVGKAEHPACGALRGAARARPRSAAAASARARMGEIGCRVNSPAPSPAPAEA